jgi:hypothetical protein
MLLLPRGKYQALCPDCNTQREVVNLELGMGGYMGTALAFTRSSELVWLVEGV